jgi:hypothetical protein
MEVVVKTTYNRLQKILMCCIQNISAAVVCDASTCPAITRQDHREAADWLNYMLMNIKSNIQYDTRRVFKYLHLQYGSPDQKKQFK